MEAVPGVAVQPRQDDIGNNRTHAKRLAGKANTKRVTHEAAAAIGADEVARSNDLLAGFAGEPRGHAISILLQTDQFAAELHTVAELEQTFAHHAFGQELRHHQRDVVGLGRRRVPCSMTSDTVKLPSSRYSRCGG